MIRTLLIAAIVILLASCGGSDSAGTDPRISEVQEDLNAARELWQDNGLIDYMFVFDPSINRACLPEGVVADEAPPWLVTIENNEVISVIDTFTNEPIQIPTADYFGTIDDIFKYLEQQLAEGPQVVSLSFNTQDELPTFDDSFGYPKQFYLEFNNNNECRSIQITLSNFR